MAMLAWIMMGLAIWHFTIFIPDRFWGGIVGAFVGALIGAMVFGLAVNGVTIPGGSSSVDALSRRRGARRLLACLESAYVDASPSRWSGCL